MSSMRALKRKIQKSNGSLVHKKAVANKMGISVRELNEQMAERERKLKAMEGGYDE